MHKISEKGYTKTFVGVQQFLLNKFCKIHTGLPVNINTHHSIYTRYS